MNILKTNILDTCPGGFCDYIQTNAEALVVILCVDGFIFLVTLLPPLFSWSNKKPDGRKRIYFAALACFTFYFWLAFLAVNSLYCFGFLAHHGPCKKPVNSSLPVTLIPSVQSPNAASGNGKTAAGSNGLHNTASTASLGTVPAFENSIERPTSTRSNYQSSRHSEQPTVLAYTSSITSLMTSGASIGKKSTMLAASSLRDLLLCFFLLTVCKSFDRSTLYHRKKVLQHF